MKPARLLKSTAIIASLTLFSRLLGLIRDILIASYLGAGAISDAFFTAFKLPNVFRRMFAEGAFNAAFVPLYARRIEEDGDDAANNFASEVGSMLFTVVIGIIIFFELTMPWSLNIIGYGLDNHFGFDKKHIGTALSVAITISGVAQAGLVYWGCKRIGIKFHLRRPRLTPNVKRLVILGVPGIISAGITQINLVVSHSIATMQQSAASWLTYADRLYQLPLGMIGIAMGIALLPALSRRIRANDEAGANMSFNRGMEIAAFLTLPAAVALYVIPELLIAGIYQRGEFITETTLQVAKALRFFALGLPAFVMIKVLTPAFFARENTKTPMIYAALSAFINIKPCGLSV